MSYIINNSRGNIVAVIPDGTTNTTSTSLSLVGQGVTNYGTAENENWVYLLENFASPSAPLQAILGQLWYNSATDTLSSYSTGNVWIGLASNTYVDAQKISPAFTGIPTAPTAANGTSTTQIATTAYVQNQLTGSGGIDTTGPITGGNISSTGVISAVGGIVTSGNISATGTISASGTVTGGNLYTGGTAIATGNITGGNVTAVGSVTATNGTVRLARLTSTQRDALVPVNGDLIYNTTTDYVQCYQAGVWVNMTQARYN
jgi:hypothetical protein